MSTVTINDLQKGIIHIKKLGYKTYSFCKNTTDLVDLARLKTSNINDSNPICNRLFVILSNNAVTTEIVTDYKKNVIIHARKPTHIIDSFFSEGCYILQK